MATVEWKSDIMVFGEGHNNAPWAKVERFGCKTPSYYWTAHRPGTDTVDGWANTLEDAQRHVEDWLFPDKG